MTQSRYFVSVRNKTAWVNKRLHINSSGKNLSVKQSGSYKKNISDKMKKKKEIASGKDTKRKQNSIEEKQMILSCGIISHET